MGTMVHHEKEIRKLADKRKLELQRVADKIKMKEDGNEAHKTVILPKYEFDTRLNIQREVQKPPATIYMEMGFNSEHPTDPSLEKKHYRRFYDDELENVKEIFPKMPFYTVDIIRGQSRGLSKSWFNMFSKPKTDESGQLTNVKVVGKFKGRLNIVNKSDKDSHRAAKGDKIKVIFEQLEDLHLKKYGTALSFKLADLESFEKSLKFEHVLEDLGVENLGILAFLKEQSYAEMITKQLLQKTKCMIRLYVIEGYDFAQRDIGSFSDPYLKIRCGNNKYNERENY